MGAIKTGRGNIVQGPLTIFVASTFGHGYRFHLQSLIKLITGNLVQLTIGLNRQYVQELTAFALPETVLIRGIRHFSESYCALALSVFFHNGRNKFAQNKTADNQYQAGLYHQPYESCH